MKTPLFVRKQKGGMFSVVNETMTTGNIFFVDSGSSSGADSTGYGLNPDAPFLTLAYAIAACTTANGDMIFLMPGHAEAPVATITVNKAGLTIVGIGNGQNRPMITAAHTIASDDVLDITSDDVTIKNIYIAAGTNSAGNSFQLNVNADDFTIEDSVIEMGAKNLVGCTLVGGKSRTKFKNVTFRGTAANPDCAIDLEGSGKHNNLVVENCFFNFDGSAGLDEAGIRSSKLETGILIKDCVFIGMDATALDFNSSATGLVMNVAVDSNSTTVAEMIDAAHLSCVDVRVASVAKSGARIPATTATP